MLKQTTGSVLVLEDEILILLDIEDYLRAAGFQIAAAFASCASALGWLSNHTADIAILDIELRDGVCAAVARLLHQRGIPFIVYSASSYNAEYHDEVFQHGDWLLKPSNPSDVITSLRKRSHFAASRSNLEAAASNRFLKGRARPSRYSNRMDIFID